MSAEWRGHMARARGYDAVHDEDAPTQTSGEPVTLYWRPRPAECLPDLAPAEIVAETLDAIREREREHGLERTEWALCLRALAELHAGELVAEQDNHAAALEALAHSEALALDGASVRTLDRVMDALVAFEVRATTDPAGAARALCRWLRKLRGGAKKEAA